MRPSSLLSLGFRDVKKCGGDARHVRALGLRTLRIPYSVQLLEGDSVVPVGLAWLRLFHSVPSASDIVVKACQPRLGPRAAYGPSAA